MKPLVFFKAEGYTCCNIVAASSHEDCLNLVRYFKKYWQADVQEVFDTGFSATFNVIMPGRYFLISHGSQIGNSLSAPGQHIHRVIPDILSDLDSRQGQE